MQGVGLVLREHVVLEIALPMAVLERQCQVGLMQSPDKPAGLARGSTTSLPAMVMVAILSLRKVTCFFVNCALHAGWHHGWWLEF